MGSTNSSENCSQLTIREYKIIYGTRAGVASISFFCSMAGILIILLFKKYLFLTQRLIMYLCIAAALSSLAKVINITPQIYYNSEDHSAHTFCSIAGFVNQYTYSALVLAVTCITVDVFIVAVFDWKTTKLEPLYILTTFFLPALFTWLPFIENTYEDIGGWCWIISKKDPGCELFWFGIALRIILMYDLLLVLIPLQVLLLLVILCILYSQRYKYDNRFDERRSARKEIKKLIWYPIIFVFIDIFLIIDVVYTYTNFHEKKFQALLLAAIISSLQGAFITLVFVLDSETRKRLTWVQIKGALVRICGRKDIVQYYPSTIEELSDSLVVQSKEEEDELKTEYELGK